MATARARSSDSVWLLAVEPTVSVWPYTSIRLLGYWIRLLATSFSVAWNDGLIAVLPWLIASGAFAFYVANFGSYNKTYGSLAAVIIFLVWLWISNIAILLGAEFDAEIQRSRAIQAGHDETDEPYLDLRDTRKLDTDDKRKKD